MVSCELQGTAYPRSILVAGARGEVARIQISLHPKLGMQVLVQ